MSELSQTDRSSRLVGHSKSVQSKYDYIKIKIWLGADKVHYYILSRYILSRTLTCAKIPQDSAIKIALRLKKWLVDNDIFDLHQEELEHYMFRSIQEEGFTDVEIARFKLVNRFKQSRHPLVIFMCGLPSDTKTRIAQELSHSLHVPNVLRTDDIEDILQFHPSVNMKKHTSILDTSLATASSVIQEYKNECLIISKAIRQDVLKAFKDGKSIIIEGFHLDPEYIIGQYNPMRCGEIRDALVSTAQQEVDDTPQRNDRDGHHDALVIPILIHMEDDQYPIDAQSWFLSLSQDQGMDTREISLQNLVDRVHGTIGGYLRQVCTAHAIPMICVDMVDWNKALEEIHEHILKGMEMMMQIDDE